MSDYAADGAPYRNPPQAGQQPQPARPQRRPFLQHRIANQAQAADQAMGNAHPAPAWSPDTPMHMPLALVTTADEPGGGTMTLGMSDLVPLVTADGAVIPASGPGRWGQLRAAGRP